MGWGRKAELILAGEWSPIRIFSLENGKAEEVQVKGLANSAGWISALEVADVDGNGLSDILIGNLGLNSKLKASKEKPVWLYHFDFDGNGQADPVIFHYMGEKLVPFATRDDLIRQIPEIKRKHSSYAEYAKIQQPEDLLSKEKLALARKLPAYEFRSGVYLQKEPGVFRFIPFPAEAQWSPVMSLAFSPLTQKIALGFNSSDLRVDLGKSLNGRPMLMSWKNNSWSLEYPKTPKSSNPEIRQIREIRWKGTPIFLGAENNGPLIPYQ